MTFHADDEFDLERMIDGELSFAEQKAALERLDVVPDGWRRLALGLLEHQVFRREFQQHVAPRVSPETLPVAAAAAPVAPSRGRLWAKRVAMAAVCLACLVSGMQIEQVRGRGGNLVANGPAVSPAISEVPTDRASSETLAQNDASGDDASNNDEGASGQTMKVAFADWPTPIEVPVVETDDDDASDLLEQSAVSEEMRKAWASAGYVIYEDRKYVPVPLGNGREGIAPISDIVVEYVGTDDYQ